MELDLAILFSPTHTLFLFSLLLPLVSGIFIFFGMLDILFELAAWNGVFPRELNIINFGGHCHVAY